MMIRTRALAAVGVTLLGAVFLSAAVLAQKSGTTTADQPAFDRHSAWQTWKVYCDTCHFGPKARANLNLESLDLANLDSNGALWEKVLRKLRSREMPPPGSPRPEPAVYDALVRRSRANATAPWT
jgi:hypothetical protein